jgi:hypothetical protein
MQIFNPKQAKKHQLIKTQLPQTHQVHQKEDF